MLGAGEALGGELLFSHAPSSKVLGWAPFPSESLQAKCWEGCFSLLSPIIPIRKALGGALLTYETHSSKALGGALLLPSHFS